MNNRQGLEMGSWLDRSEEGTGDCNFLNHCVYIFLSEAPLLQFSYM